MLYLYLLGGLACAAGLELTMKHILKKVDTKVMLFYRGLFMIGISVLALPWIPLQVTNNELGLMAVVGILAALGYFLRSNALKNLEISYIAPTFGLSPIFVTFFAFLLIQEIPSSSQLFGIVLVSISIYILELQKNIRPLEPLKKFFTNVYARQSLYAGLIFGVTVTLDRLILSGGTHPLTYLFFVWLFINTVHIIDALIHRRSRLSASQELPRIFLTAVLIIFLHVFFYFALTLAQAGVVSAIYSLQIFVIAIFGGAFFKDKDRKKRSLAAFLVTIGGILIALG